MTSEPLVIRPVEAHDHGAWKPLFDGYNAFYGRAVPTALADEIVGTTWQRFFDPAEPVHGLVAVDGGRIVGLTHYLYHRSTTRIELTCYLQDLYTAEEARGRGVGRALIEAVAERARAGDAGRVYWHTHETNATAMRLYDAVAQRSGFVVYRKPL